MLGKPFKPPLLKKSPQQDTQISPSQPQDDGPPTKKRRLSPENEAPPTAPKAQIIPSSQCQNAASFNKPTFTVQRPAAKPTTDPSIAAGFSEAYYNVLWRTHQAKKHKTWDGDGILIVASGYACLRDVNGREMGKTKCVGPLLPETTLSVGSKHVQIEAVIPKEEFLSGRTFLSGAVKQHTMKDVEEKQRTNVKFNAKQMESAAHKTSIPPVVKQQPPKLPKSTMPSLPSLLTTTKFKNPLKESTVLPKGNGETPVPRHDPNALGALVMKRPLHVPTGKQVVDVVVDPILTKKLREHQRVGVQFLYECVMGMRPHNGDGAILADEMGLGKTLQVIALLWTLLKQNPIHGDPPVVKKALIVCPVTLISNWKKEFRKWLGLERVGVFVLDDKQKRNKLTDFTLGKSYPIMIIGYEKLRMLQDEMQRGTGVDIVIADEGHRLKTAKNKSAQALKSLSTSRKIILSGTPMQNDLSEFYFAVDLINPGLLGKVSTFKREFETPILRSRQPEASERELEKGQARSEELIKLTSLFMLRRTSEILAEFLPKKSEYVLYCRPTFAQASAYKSLLSSSTFSAVLNAPEASLQLIGILKKLCNSPSLLRNKDGDSESSAMISSLIHAIPQSVFKNPGASGKLQVLDSLLHRLRTTTNEKVVLVSHYTATLDILENLLTALGYRYLRLDGSTAQSKRQELVERFNRTDASTCFAFLLSAKSGGVGLNLTGASRLVLFDSDWNPSTDLQAMARIHRDGQKHPCKIYRLLTKGALDEKIYQRQLTKLSLADSVVDNKVSVSSFTKDELRDLFSLNESESCQTHDLLGCDCGETGIDHDIDSGLITPAATDDLLNNDEDEESLSDIDDNNNSRTEKALPSLPEMLTASQVLRESTENEEFRHELSPKRKNSKKRMQMTLMRYRHFDVAKLVAQLQKGAVENENDRNQLEESSDRDIENPEAEYAAFDIEVALDDDVLLDVLKDSENRISHVFAKTK